MKNLIASSLKFLLVILIFNNAFGQKALEKQEFTLKPSFENAITVDQADKIFKFFKTEQLFKWNDNNNCEDRANAVSLILDSWKIPNYKVWIFSGNFLKLNQGRLNRGWKYHVAVGIPTNTGELLVIDYAIPPIDSPKTVQIWANDLVKSPNGYYFVTKNNLYNWSLKKSKPFSLDSFYLTNNENFEYTIEGLTGFNGGSSSPLNFLNRIGLGEKKKEAKARLEFLKNNKPTL